jgi:hypothetical protein
MGTWRQVDFLYDRKQQTYKGDALDFLDPNYKPRSRVYMAGLRTTGI